jgi:hypothetical protein
VNYDESVVIRKLQRRMSVLPQRTAAPVCVGVSAHGGTVGDVSHDTGGLGGVMTTGLESSGAAGASCSTGSRSCSSRDFHVHNPLLQSHRLPGGAVTTVSLDESAFNGNHGSIMHRQSCLPPHRRSMLGLLTGRYGQPAPRTTACWSRDAQSNHASSVVCSADQAATTALDRASSTSATVLLQAAHSSAGSSRNPVGCTSAGDAEGVRAPCSRVLDVEVDSGDVPPKATTVASPSAPSSTCLPLHVPVTRTCPSESASQVMGTSESDSRLARVTLLGKAKSSAPA